MTRSKRTTVLKDERRGYQGRKQEGKGTKIAEDIKVDIPVM